MESSQTASGVTTRSAGVRYGVISAVIGIAYFLVVTSIGGDMTEGVWAWLIYPITIAMIFLAQKYFKDNGDGFMTYGQGVGISFWVGLVSGAIGAIFFLLYVKFIDPSFITMIKDKQIQKMEEAGRSQEQIDQGMKIAGIFMTPIAMSLIRFIGGIFGNVVTGLLVSIFTQKKGPEQAF
jgi:uncharacterized protein (DUF697 family)